MKFEFELYRALSKSKNAPKSMKLILNSNDRMDFHQKAKFVAKLKVLAQVEVKKRFTAEIKEAMLPIFTKDKWCCVTLTVFTPTNRKSDPDNLQPTLKAIMDGFTEAGLWSDDNHEVVKYTKYQYGGLSGTKAYRLEVDIEDLTFHL
ncbi:hypothetical protein ACVVIB_08555 [Lactococcus lactis]